MRDDPEGKGGGVGASDSPDGARCPGLSLADLKARDPRETPALFDPVYEFLGSEDLPAAAYTAPDVHAAEVEKVWKKVWQMACREEDIPAVGDHVLYEIAGERLIIVRSAPDRIQAHYNACLHRGRELRDGDGCVKAFRCPFHGFTWNLDGTFKEAPCAWDFPHVAREDFSLPKAHVATWGGFVFVNLSEDPEPLEDYLELVPAHFRNYPPEDRFKFAHVAKVVDCNWKVGLEAFIEAYHVMETHPQGLPYIGDAMAQYDIFPGVRHVSRMIVPHSHPSPHLGDDVTPMETLEALARDARPPKPKQEGRASNAQAGRIDPTAAIDLKPGQTAREVVAAQKRNRLAQAMGRSMDHISESEALDTIQYFIFPNMVLWNAYGSPICYRFRPWGKAPDQCLFEIMYLVQFDTSKPRPAAAKMTMLGSDETFVDAPELGGAGIVFDQDLSNMTHVQRGLQTTKKPGVTLGNYQEVRIRHFHQTLQHYLGG